MAIHKKAAVSYGNEWLQTFSQPIPWIGKGCRGGGRHVAFRSGEDRQNDAAELVAGSPP
jgi:hypothetical protein